MIRMNPFIWFQRSTKACLLFSLVFYVTELTVAQPYSFFAHIPSSSAVGEGIALWIKAPSTERYGGSGAPIAVYLAGGFKGEGIGDKEAGLIDEGFIEISFNFPGNGTGNKKSGGVYDNRGPLSLRAARDVIRFALGKLADLNGKYLSDIVTPIVPLHSNVGLIGYSNGGNTNICVAGVHGGEIDELAWILNWESPVGDGMPQAEAGAKQEGILRPFNQETNPAYDPTTGSWDLSSLSFDDSIRIPVLDNTDENVIGGLYFDFDDDDTVDTGEDFIPYPLVFETGSGHKGYYSERLREDAQRKNLFPVPPPPHIPTVAETESFWYWRNGEYWIDSTLQKIPQIMFMVVGSDTDHVQRAPDHPHVLLQYERFRIAGARFVRLNPDQAYVEDILGYSAPNAVDNAAFAHFDHSSIHQSIEPGSYLGELGRDIIVPAGACELADRTKYDNLDPQLDDVITSVANISEAPTNFHLYQNFPNPFNHQTVIQFSLRQPCHVTLEIFNLLG